MPGPVLRLRQFDVTGQRRQRFVIPSSQPLPGGERLVDAFQLRQTDGRRDVGHSIIETDLRKPIAPLRVLALPAEVAHLFGQIFAIGHDHAALAGGDDLVSEKAERATLRETAHAPALVFRAVRLGGVLDDD